MTPVTLSEIVCGALYEHDEFGISHFSDLWTGPGHLTLGFMYWLEALCDY